MGGRYQGNAASGRRALITGITGQDGGYLTELLLSKGYQVYGLVRGQNNPKEPGLRAEFPEVHILHGDLLDMSSLVSAMHVAQPDEVYNLAAVTFVAYSWQNPRLTFDVTGGGVLNMLEAVRLYQQVSGHDVRYYQASSAEMFGNAQETPLRESSPFYPRSPYGAAKAYGHYMTVNYRESYGMHASSAMLFNHESPRRGTEFVTRRISQAVARISLGLQDTISLGNLQAQRDWGFAGDYVEAMHLMLQQDKPDDYVLATGEAHSVAEFLDVAFAVIGVDDWSRHVRVDAAQLRPADVNVLIGDAAKARSVLGWKPRMSFVELVALMVESDIAAQSVAALRR
ncbi:GDP-mannose 4,6-dehydratase [Mycobacterium sp. ACS1612]|uniref:GDP-mannose 4,6-dehydratase n=1 Tax=Mycobacterium sp. ACS1612 TaxID=1834117 RepID=UPI0008014F8D|nr:GDP-mannose 4,6-dehydratase [Mycobacterium sp. ACS1612]OBF29398.1 GDP-mannose 4,6-dehydratase [Mycobacterium sp. ACS1612]